MAIPIEVRFWSKVTLSEGCWEWEHPRLSGYGDFRIGDRKVRAHRFMWELVRGPIPAGKCILHRCDNPACVRPDHLFLGTMQDNAIDRETKKRGRDSRGTANGRDRLAEADVLAIRAACAAGTKRYQVALHYGVCLSTIHKIVARETWRHI